MYILDGYNVIRSSDDLSRGSLLQQRERLIGLIDRRSPQGSSRNSVTVVFDGQPDVSSPDLSTHTRVLYSPGPSADDVIKNCVDNHPNPRDVVVVTDDRSIRKWVAGAGARVMSCDDFIRRLAEPMPPPKRRPEKPDGLAAQDLNRELSRLWKLK